MRKCISKTQYYKSLIFNKEKFCSVIQQSFDCVDQYRLSDMYKVAWRYCFCDELKKAGLATYLHESGEIPDVFIRVASNDQFGDMSSDCRYQVDMNNSPAIEVQNLKAHLLTVFGSIERWHAWKSFYGEWARLSLDALKGTLSGAQYNMRIVDIVEFITWLVSGTIAPDRKQALANVESLGLGTSNPAKCTFEFQGIRVDVYKSGKLKLSGLRDAGVCSKIADLKAMRALDWRIEQ